MKAGLGMHNLNKFLEGPASPCMATHLMSPLMKQKGRVTNHSWSLGMYVLGPGIIFVDGGLTLRA